MNKSQIESMLIDWFNEMIAKYEWLRFRYEYSEKLGVFLVGYYPASKVDAIDEFSIDAMRFEDKVNFELGCAAPLFGTEEECFKLSPNAEEIKHKTNIWVIPTQSFCLPVHNNHTFEFELNHSYDSNCIYELENAA